MRKPIMYPRKPISGIYTPYGYIYIIRNCITGKPYIGQKNSPVFVKSYWGSSEDLLNDIKSLGFENFSREILDWAKTKDELNEKEIYWIETIGTFHGFGYNRSRGGDGLGYGKDHPCYGKHYNTGESNPFYGKGIQMTKEVKEKMSIAKQESKGIKNNFFGHHHTEEWKEQYRNGGNNPLAKSVYQYDLLGNLVHKFSYLKEVSEFGYSKDAVGSRCNLKVHKFVNQRMSYKNYIWSYLSPIQGKLPPLENEPKYQKM